jgi:multidrug efflux pump subunit AcrB
VVDVSAAWEGTAAEDVEVLVTRPLEDALSAVPGVARISSTSTRGAAAVRVEFEVGVDQDLARAAVLEAAQVVSARLPDGVEPVVMRPADAPVERGGPRSWEAVLTGPDHFALEPMAPSVVGALAQAGCGEVSDTTPEAVPELVITLDQARLLAFGLPEVELEAVARACDPGATVTAAEARLRPGRCDPHDLGAAVIGVVEEHPLYLRDVARMELRAAPMALTRDDLRPSRALRVEGSPTCRERDLAEALALVPLPEGVTVELRELP